MEQLMKIDNEYASWIAELARRYRSSQIKVASSGVWRSAVASERHIHTRRV